MQPQQPNNFDFILNPASAPKKSPFGGNSMLGRIVVVLVGLFALAIIAAVVTHFIGSANAAFSKTAMLSVLQDQTELARVSDLGTQSAVDQTLKNFSATTKLGITTDQQTLGTYVASAGYKVPTKQLGLKQSAKTDASLTSAQSSSTFDAVYGDIMKQNLLSYQADLKSAYADANAKTKAVLSTDYNNATLLLQQLNGTH